MDKLTTHILRSCAPSNDMAGRLQISERNIVRYIEPMQSSVDIRDSLCRSARKQQVPDNHPSRGQGRNAQHAVTLHDDPIIPLNNLTAVNERCHDGERHLNPSAAFQSAKDGISLDEHRICEKRQPTVTFDLTRRIRLILHDRRAGDGAVSIDKRQRVFSFPSFGDPG